jgi:hypothetical protein
MPAIPCPPTMASMFGQSQSITRRSTSVIRTGAVDVLVIPSSVRRKPSRNLGTSRNNCYSVIVICTLAISEMLESCSWPKVSTGSKLTCKPLVVLFATWARILAT